MKDDIQTRWNAPALQDDAHDHLISPFEDMGKLGTSGGRPMLVKGDGVYVTNAEGRRLLDGPAGMWCTQVGYACPEIAQAIAAQAMQISYTSPWYFLNGPSAALSRRIAAVTPGDLNHVFFTTGGSSAVDSALRFVQFFNNVLGRPEKKMLLCRVDGYHGSTHLSAAVSGRAGNKPNFDLALDNVSFLSAPNTFRRPSQMSEEGFLAHLLQEMQERIETLGPERIGAFIAEPILASGGILMPPEGYHQATLELCRKHDILYISDEVVTAFGRLGHWFASEDEFGITPDIVTFAKGVTSGYVPLGGFAISDRVLARISGENARGSFYSNGYTYSGHPVACAAALANMDVFEDRNLLAHVRDIAPYFMAGLQSLKDLPLVGDVRGRGLLGCVECQTDPKSDAATDFDIKVAARIDRHCYEKGLIVRPIGAICVMSPALIITREQIDELVSILRDSIEIVQDELREEGLWNG